MSTEQILQILRIGLNVAAIALIVSAVLFFLRGLLRGWKYGLFRFVFFAAAIAAALLTLGPLANWVGTFDLTRFGIPTIKITVNNTECSATFGTIFDTLESLFSQMLVAAGMTGSVSKVVSTASALAVSFVKLVLIFVWGVVLSTVGLLLCLLLWHCCFKFVFHARKKKKHGRIASAFSDLAIGLALCAMMITPFTGVANSLANHADLDKDTAAKNETTALVYDVLDIYKDSMFAKTFFSWNKLDGVDSIDTELINFLTASEVDGVSTKMLDDLGNLVDLGSALFNTGVLSFDGESIVNWSVLLSRDALPAILYLLADNDLVMNLLPVAVSFATGLDEVKSVLDPSTIDWIVNEESDWSSELKNLAKVWVSLADAGVLDGFSEENGTLTFDFSALQHIVTGRSDADGTPCDVYGAMHQALSLADTELINRLIAGCLYQASTSEDSWLNQGDDGSSSIRVTDFLPKDEEGNISYEKLLDVEWFSELGLIYDTLYRINLIDDAIIPSLFDQLSSNAKSSRYAPKGEASSEDSSGFDLSPILSLVANHSEEIIPILVGPRDSSEKPIADASGKGKDSASESLLDSELIVNGLPSVLDFLETFLSDSLSVDLDLSDAKSKLNLENHSERRIAYKEEFGHVFDLVSKFCSTEEGKAFLCDLEGQPGIHYTPDGSLDSIDQGLVDGLQNALPSMDSSLILSSALPTVFEHFLDGESSPLASFGDFTFDFHCENLGYELSSLLDFVAHCPNLLRDFSGASSLSTDQMLDLVSEDSEEIVYLIDVFARSSILNPVIDGKSNVNITELLNNLFGNAGLGDDFSLEEETLSGVRIYNTLSYDGDFLRDASGDPIYDGESGALVKVLVDLVDSGIASDLSNLGSMSSTQIIKTLSKVDLETLFADIGESTIIRAILPDMLDGYFVSILGTEELGMKSDITFSNVTDWAAEGKAIQTILNLAMNGVDLSNFDFFGSDAGTVAGLLQSLAKSQMFLKGDDYVFPTYLYNKLLASTLGGSLSYFVDEGADASFATDLAKAQAITTALKASIDSVAAGMTGEDAMEAWAGDGGEIEAVGAILQDVSLLGGMEGISSFSAEKLPALKAALFDLNSCQALGGPLLSNIVAQAASSVEDSETIQFSSLNTHAMWEMDEADRAVELGHFLDVISVLFDSNYGLVKNGAINLSSLHLKTISTTYLLEPLLEGCRESVLFSTVAEEATLRYDASVYTASVTDPNGSTYADSTGLLSFEGNTLRGTYKVDLLKDGAAFARYSFRVKRGVDSSYTLASASSYDDSLFEQLAETLIKNAGLYECASYSAASGTYSYGVLPSIDSEINAHLMPGLSIRSLVLSVSASMDWADEIAKLLQAMDVLQSSPFLNASGDFDTSALSDLETLFQDSAMVSSLQSIFHALNDSELLYRVLPAKLDEALVGSNPLGTSDFGTDLSYADAYCMADSDGVAPYADEEIDRLVSIFRSLSQCSSASSTDITSLPSDALADGLSEMGQSAIFNSSIWKSELLVPASSDSAFERGHTSFQLLMRDILATPALQEYLYSGSNPKDVALLSDYLAYKPTFSGSGSNGETYADYKAMYLVDRFLPALSSPSDLWDASSIELISGDSGSIRSALSSLCSDSLSSAVSGSSLSLSGLDGSTIAELLRALNDCPLLSDCVPNALSEMASDPSFSVSGIDMGLLNFYFSYWYCDESGALLPSPRDDAHPDYDAKFCDVEIDQLAVIFDELRTSGSKLSSFDLANVDLLMVRNILIDLENSYLAHMAGPNVRSASYGAFNVASGKTDLTVFEQFMYLVYDESGIAEQAFSPFYDLDLYLAHGNDGYRYKLHDQIVSFSAGTLSGLNGCSWLKEIEALTTDGLGSHGGEYVGLFKTAQKLGLLDGSSLAGDPDAMKKFSPTSIRKLLKALNGQDVCQDALSNVIESLLNQSGIGMNEFSSIAMSFTASGFLSCSDYTSAGYFDAASLYLDGEEAPHYVDLVYSSSSSLLSSVFMDSDGDGIYETNAASLIEESEESGVYTVNLSSLSRPFAVALSSSVSFKVRVDTAVYGLSQTDWASKDIDCIGLLLESAYEPSAVDGKYFEFDGDSADVLSDFLSAGHSTYGLLNILLKSDFYQGMGFDSSRSRVSLSASSYRSRDYTLHHMLRTNQTVNGVSFTVSLGDCLGQEGSLSEAERYTTIHTLLEKEDPNVFREASWIDGNIKNAGLLLAYNAAYESLESSGAFNASSFQLVGSMISSYDIAENGGVLSMKNNALEDVISRTASGTAYSFTLSDGTAQEGDASERSFFGSQILAGFYRDFQGYEMDYVSLSSHASSVGADGARTAYVYASDGVGGYVEEIYDAYGYDSGTDSYSYPIFENGVLTRLVASMKASALLQDCISSGGTLDALKKAALLSALDSLDADPSDSTGIRASRDKAYLSHVYDYLVLTGVYYSLGLSTVDYIDARNFSATEFATSIHGAVEARFA